MNDYSVLFIIIKGLYGLLLSFSFIMTIRTRSKNLKIPPRNKYYREIYATRKGRSLDYLFLIMLAGGGLLLVAYFPQNFLIAAVACALIIAGALCGNHIDNVAAKNQHKAELHCQT